MQEKENQNNLPATEPYAAPHIEVIDIEVSQNILGGSGTLPDMPGDDW